MVLEPVREHDADALDRRQAVIVDLDVHALALGGHRVVAGSSPRGSSRSASSLHLLLRDFRHANYLTPQGMGTFLFARSQYDRALAEARRSHP
jgi:hypothetical protein